MLVWRFSESQSFSLPCHSSFAPGALKVNRRPGSGLLWFSAGSERLGNGDSGRSRSFARHAEAENALPRHDYYAAPQFDLDHPSPFTLETCVVTSPHELPAITPVD